LAGAAQPLELSWQAPPGCPQQEAVREQIRALVPSALLESGGVKAEGTITRVEQRYRLNLLLSLGDIRGERNIDSDSCSDLAGAAAVALGLLLQSAAQPNAAPTDGTHPESPHDGLPDADTATTPSSSPPVPAAPRAMLTSATPESPASRSRSWRVVLPAPALAIDVGPLPKPTLGMAAGVGFSAERWLFAASFELPRRQRLELSGPSGAGAELEHWSAELAGCRSWRVSRLELGPCLVIGLERLTASGTGAGVSPQSEQATWASFGAAALGQLHIADWLAVTASAGAQWQGARPTIRIDGLADTRRLPPAALGFRAGPMLIF
jgi:hypothetical protein